MRHKKTAKASSRMTRGVKVASKRRHARKPSVRNRTAERITEKLNILTPL